MSEKEPEDQKLGSPGLPDAGETGGDAGAGRKGSAAAGEGRGKTPSRSPAKSKEDRLAEALRANLRRRKEAARSRKDG